MIKSAPMNRLREIRVSAVPNGAGCRESALSRGRRLIRATLGMPRGNAQGALPLSQTTLIGRVLMRPSI